ncbi:outer membrane lipoprotein chaperone LolA [Motilimonas cestriensis]|uniref:outer membrane lipoprotein chaperone LolA n=1 Tax=Motilimonas cestriensis TaxID=2742685 RepID=UPI003DA44BBF
MNKLSLLLTSGFTSLMLFSSSVWADAAQDLQQKLHKVSQFSANFSQQVLDLDGKVIQEASGELNVAHPDKFRWQVLMPDEELVLSNGNTVWVYSPFVEQVTLLDQADAVAGTPFLLLASTDKAVWQQYEVVAKQQEFVIKPKDEQASIAEFTMKFNQKDQLIGFSIKERQGQTSQFVLTEFNSKNTFKGSDFEFVIPEGVEVDDQR